MSVYGAGAAPVWSEPESATGPRTSGAALKSGGSATLILSEHSSNPWLTMIRHVGEVLADLKRRKKLAYAVTHNV